MIVWFANVALAEIWGILEKELIYQSFDQVVFSTLDAMMNKFEWINIFVVILKVTINLINMCLI